MPLFHIHGLVAAVLASLTAGASVVCCPGFDAPKFFEWVDEFRPTWYTAVPTIHQSVVSRAAAHADVIARHRFRFIRSCSSALAPSLMHEMEAVFQAPVVEAYGMTEAAHQMTSNPLPPLERRPGSVGLPAGPEVAIMSEAGDLLQPGSTGEVVIRGPNVTPGYSANADANLRAYTNGWFRTGDQGRLDDAGYLFLSGRLKEIVNRGGEKISPREIDEVLLRHPAVAQAVAFSIAHASLGETVGAAVVLRSGHAVSERELREHASTHLVDFKVPEQIVFLEEIPKGPTGKIQRIGLASVLGVEQRRNRAPAPAGYVAPSSATERQITRILAGILGVERAGMEDNFFDLGGDSLLLTRFLAAIRDETGVDIPVLKFFDRPTASGVCAAVTEGAAGARGSILRVMVRAGGSEPPLFCIPGSEGDITGFFNLARHLDQNRPVVAFQFPGRDEMDYRLPDLAARYIAEIREVRSQGPYGLLGECTGGLVAYEMARQLASRGEAIAVLALVDCYNHAYSVNSGRFEKLLYRSRLLEKRIRYQARELRRAPSAKVYLRLKLAALKQTRRQRAREWVHGVLLRLGLEAPNDLKDSTLAIRRAAAQYFPNGWPGSLELFRAEEPRVDGFDYPEMGWSGRARGGIRIHDVSCGHRAMLAEPNVRLIAKRLQDSLKPQKSEA